jgi:outer membrane protein assembly factor BamD
VPVRRGGVVVALAAAASVACGGGDPYQGLDADALFRIAENEYADEDWDNAIEVLERLTINFPDWSRVAEARMMLADAHFEDGEYLTARSEYLRFRDRFVGHPLSAVAALGECRSLAALSPHPQRDQTHTRDAVTACGNVTVDFAGTPQAAEAGQLRDSLRAKLAEKDYLTASHYFRRRQYDPAIVYYQFVVDQYPETEFAPQALAGLYRANLAIGYDDLAEQARDRLLRSYPASEAAQELQANGDES